MKIYGVLYEHLDAQVFEGDVTCSGEKHGCDGVCDAVIVKLEEELQHNFKTRFVKVFGTKEEANAFIESNIRKVLLKSGIKFDDICEYYKRDLTRDRFIERMRVMQLTRKGEVL